MSAEADLHPSVRAATIADRDALAPFLSRAARNENVDQFDILGYVREFVLPISQVTSGQLFVAKQAWSIVGLASVIFRHDGDVEIDCFIDRSAGG